MRKELLLSLLVLLVSCAGNNQSTQSEETTSSFISEDLKKFGLMGHVQKRDFIRAEPFITTMEYNGELLFDADGVLTNDLGEHTALCNEDGFIYKYVVDYYDGSHFEIEFLELNEYGWPLKAQAHSETPYDITENEYSYEYLKTDDAGNWVERKVMNVSKISLMDEFTGEYAAPYTENNEWIDYSDLTYYE